MGANYTNTMAHPQPDLPDELGDYDCPICYEPNSIRDREAICPNGHTFCSDCQPRIQSVRTGWGLGQRGIACCPMCRGHIPYVPLGGGPAVAPIDDAAALRAVNAIQAAGGEPPPPPPPVYRWVNDPGRPQRAIDGFNNLPERRQAQALFRQARDEGRIPQNAAFGGIHKRNCPCGRRHGANGVRFLKMPGGKRLYRCEACYIAAYNEPPPPPPAWSLNGLALAAHEDQNL